MAALVPSLPDDTADAPSLLVVGALPEIVEDQFSRLFDDLGLGTGRFFPPRRASDLPPVGPRTRMLLAQPFLAETARLLGARGAELLVAPFPIGIEGTTAWLQAAATAFGVDPVTFRRVTEPCRDRARRVREHALF